jgi:hypothetical protein
MGRLKEVGKPLPPIRACVRPVMVPSLPAHHRAAVDPEADGRGASHGRSAAVAIGRRQN